MAASEEERSWQLGWARGWMVSCTGSVKRWGHPLRRVCSQAPPVALCLSPSCKRWSKRCPRWCCSTSTSWRRRWKTSSTPRARGKTRLSPAARSPWDTHSTRQVRSVSVFCFRVFFLHWCVEMKRRNSWKYKMKAVSSLPQSPIICLYVWSLTIVHMALQGAVVIYFGSIRVCPGLCQLRQNSAASSPVNQRHPGSCKPALVPSDHNRLKRPSRGRCHCS